MFARSTQGPDSRTIQFERWSIDPQARRVSRRVIDPVAQEFPRFDERRIGKPYRYAFTVPLARDDASLNSASHLIRHDLQSGTRAIHEFGPRRHPGEFVFVPKHADSAEDEGWLMGLVIDAATQTTDLVILDTANFSGEPQAVVTIPHRVPPGFHGNWVPASAAQA